MRLFILKGHHFFSPVLLLLIIYALSGCAFVGPNSISQGRLSYAEAINRTENQQMLLAIAKGRYRESSTLLTVNSIAANIRFRSSVNAEFPIGADKYMDDLVPLSSGLAYEENPTVTYSPVKGEEYIRELMSPVSLDLVMVFLRSMTNNDIVLKTLVNRVNDIQNPDFLNTASGKYDKQFERFSELFDKLRDSGILDLVRDRQEGIVFDLIISNYAPDYSSEVAAFLELLDLPIPMDTSEQIVIPVSFAVMAEKPLGIGISTRSTYDLIEILRASIEVPQEHADAGLTQTFPLAGLAGQRLKINSSKTRPKDLSLAVKYRGYWFYIDEKDQITKSVFLLLNTLWSICNSDSSIQKDVPVLTIPVSR